MKPAHCTPDQETEAQELAARIEEAAKKEFLQIARLLTGKKESELFGQTEFDIRDRLFRIGAQIYEEYLREKKTAWTDQA